ncbi:hypothetical protein Hanom_Chr16g01470731 [Helianthus anomalus]
MAMAALRREGRRFAPLVSSPNPINAIRSTLAPAEYDFIFISRSRIYSSFESVYVHFYGLDSN